MWFSKKKSADHALKELVDDLSKTLGSKLISLLVYGSMASGEFHEDRSDVNVFILVSEISTEVLSLMTDPLRAWMKTGHPLPVFIPKTELQGYANAVPIEFFDMRDHHKVIFGTDPLSELKIEKTNLRPQCVQELSIKLLKLRQGVALMQGRTKELRQFLVDSLPSVLTLYRAALRLESEVPKGHKILAAKELAKRAGADDDCLERVSDLHLRRETDNLNDLSGQYLKGLERVLVYLNRQ